MNIDQTSISGDSADTVTFSVVNQPELTPSPVYNLTQQRAQAFYKRGLFGAQNSVRAYKQDIQHYLIWFADKGYTALPANIESLAEYITDLSDDNKYYTLTRRLASIAKYHRVNGELSPTTQEGFKIFFKGIRNALTIKQKEAAAFTLDELLHAVDALPLTPTGIRNKLLLLLGFTGAFRRSELVGLNVEDVHLKPEGVLITLHQSKTNQDGAEETKYVKKADNKAHCTLTTLQAWLTLIDRDSGPLFVRIRKGERITLDRLSDDFVNELTKRTFGADYTAHTLRASFVTIAKDKGLENRKIQNQTKHKTVAMLDRYDRRRDVIEYNAASELGL